jgi:hypothetical protein|uniref:Uncharacterized protein n=1 Tax=viral metagenome TaxID=1070528 RepID=A0A6C0BNV6_9ZZZZ
METNKEIMSELESLRTRVKLLEKLVLSLVEQQDAPRREPYYDSKKTHNDTYMEPSNPRRFII